MATSTSSEEDERRCYFLELPPEIRLMIYDELAQHARRQRPLLRIGFMYRGGRTKSSRQPVVAVTHVNRQVREESMSIIYRNRVLHVSINAETSAARRQAKMWSKLEVSPTVLSCITGLSFRSAEPGCCLVVINLARRHHPKAEHDCCVGLEGCDELCTAYYSSLGDVEAELKMLKADKMETHRLVMNKGILGRLVEKFCKITEENKEDEQVEEEEGEAAE